MPTIDEAIARFAEFERRLSNPVTFYQDTHKQWIGIAKRVTLQTLLHLRPPDADRDDWARHAHSITSKVTATVFDTSTQAGVTFDTRDWSQSVEFEDPSSGPSDPTGLTVDDIERWVEAGMRGEPDGKDLAMMDAGKSARQIAFRVYRAIKNQRGSWERLLGHIHEFAATQHGGESSALADAVLAEWESVLIPAIVEDWVRWVEAQVAWLG